jgi:hypothetical protein
MELAFIFLVWVIRNCVSVMCGIAIDARIDECCISGRADAMSS